jgi:mRNA interferase HigB
LREASQAAKIDGAVRVISRRRLREFWERHARAEASLRTWYKVVTTASWHDYVELRQSFPSADQVGRLVVFNVGGNRYRLVALVDYEWQKVFVRRIMTHEEYDDGGWKHDPWL